MQIDRTNYEIWLIDSLDGNLSDLQADQLRLFLIDNPDLKEEFDEMSLVSIQPSISPFPHKDHLRKSAEELPQSQFEYLCVAYLENDLQSGQIAELREIINNSEEKRRTFELIQKTKLAPVSGSYKFKNQLTRRTAKQNIFRLSVIVLSAAATVALLIISYLPIPQNLSEKSNKSSLNIMIDSNLLRLSKVEIQDKDKSESKTDKIKQKGLPRVIRRDKESSVISQSPSVAAIPNDSLQEKINIKEIQPGKVPVYAEINLKIRSAENILIKNSPRFTIPSYDDDRSTLERYITKSFRNTILKEKRLTDDTPLKGYEIAEAGVTGLNKLLGWEMALSEKNNESGELKSMYFSSKLLNFNAPVKKRGSL